MKLLAVDRWLAKYFDQDSHPPESTLRRLLKSGRLPARKVGGKWYIDEQAWLADGDALVEHVLKAG